MAPKAAKKQAAAPLEAPEAKKAKTEEEPKKEEPKEEEKKEEKFQEPDAPKDNRPALKEQVTFNTNDTTLNVVPTAGGKILASIMDSGMAYLLAGARANVAAKAGRYMFEAKVVQNTDPSFGQYKAIASRARIGFSTSESGLVLGDLSTGCIFFDSDGFCLADRKKTNVKNGRFHKDQVVAVVLNLDPKSPNFNTVALYRDGVAASEPIALPEDLKGKPLYPHICYRSCTVMVNFGPTALKELPFQCRLLGGAAASDVSVSASKAPKDGKYEVMMPVGFPDEGTFEWLDGFLEKNPQYVELSDRKIFEWAKQSGFHSRHGGKGTSNDRPAPNFGVPDLDNMSIRRVISAVAPVIPRNYLVMEVKSNLVAAERTEVLKKFNYPCYKKVARVVMGEPSSEFKANVQNKLLKEKQQKSDSAWLQKKREAEKKKAAEKARKEAAKRKAEAEKKRKEALEERKKKEEEERKKKEAEAAAKKAEEEAAAAKKAEEEAAKAAAEKKEGDEEAKEEDKKEEEKKEGDNKEEEKKEERKEEEPKEEQPKEEEKKEEEPKEEEKKEEEEKKDEPMADAEAEKSEAEPEDEETEPPQVELTDEEKEVKFLKKTVSDLAPNVMNHSFHKFSTPAKDEGFDDIVYEWDKGAKADDYLRQWVLQKKLTTRIEDLKPGKYFKDRVAEFAKVLAEWKEKLAKAPKKAPKKDDADEKEEDVDIFSVTDVCDVGEGIPLFANFTDEDWDLLELRFELSLLVMCFKKDADDEDRTGIPLDHLNFYYGKYFSRMYLDCKRYGLKEHKEVIAMVKDALKVEDGIVVQTAEEDTDDIEAFLKLTEENRRERQRRIDAGDETARLKFLPKPEPKQMRAAAAQPAKPASEAAARLGGSKPAADSVEKPDSAERPAAAKGEAKGKDQGRFGREAPRGKDMMGKDMFGKGMFGKGKDMFGKGKDMMMKGFGKGKSKW